MCLFSFFFYIDFLGWLCFSPTKNDLPFFPWSRNHFSDHLTLISSMSLFCTLYGTGLRQLSGSSPTFSSSAKFFGFLTSRLFCTSTIKSNTADPIIHNILRRNANISTNLDSLKPRPGSRKPVRCFYHFEIFLYIIFNLMCSNESRKSFHETIPDASVFLGFLCM